MASEETKILEIKVEYQEAIKKIGEYKTKIDEIKDAEARYKNEVKEGTITQQEYNERITAAKVKTNEYKTAIKVLEKQVTSQIKTQKSNADIMDEVNKLLGVNAKSIAEAQAANKALREAVRNLSDEEEGAYEMRQKLNAQIDENTRYIQRNSDEYVKQKMTIGDYKEQVKLAMVELKNGGLTMSSVGIIAKGFSDNLSRGVAQGFRDVTSGTKVFIGVLKLLKTAIIATGIGALLIALTSVAAAFQRTQQGMETFQRVSSMIGATIDVVLDRLAMLGDAVVKVFKGDFKGAADAARGAITGIGEEIKEEVKQADALKQALIQIEKEEVQLAITRSKNRAEIERLKQIAEDTSRAESERLAAAKKAYEIEQSDMQKQIKLQEKRLANMLGEVEVTEKVRNVIDRLNKGTMTADEAISMLGLSSSTMADFQQFADEVIKLNELQENSLTRQIEQKNKINTIQNAINKAVDDELEKSEKEVKDSTTLTDEEFKKEYERQQKLAQARLEAMESNSEEELALKRKINELAMNEELRQYADDEEMKLAIKEQYLAKDAALVKAYDDNKLREKEEAKKKELAIEEAKYQGMKAVTGSLIDLIDAVGESSKASAIAAKVIALAQIAIDTGIAISKAVSTSAAKGFWGFLAEVGPFIAAIVANMANAIKSVKGAKFATGGDVTGPGTGTSDSIHAMLSNGESVLTAKATSMFAPILSAMNQAGGGVPINGQKTGNQAMGEDMLARAFAKGVAGLPNPVVSVVDINNTAKRVEVIENINVI